MSEENIRRFKLAIAEDMGDEDLCILRWGIAYINKLEFENKDKAQLLASFRQQVKTLEAENVQLKKRQWGYPRYPKEDES